MIIGFLVSRAGTVCGLNVLVAQTPFVCCLRVLLVLQTCPSFSSECAFY
jgi:hypothetical protein